MAPESTPNTGAAATPTRQNVTVPAPGAGADLTVHSSAGGQLQLDFDPSSSTPGRSGNDLTFELDGGKVTVKDFFVVGDESLPSLRLPDGTVVASADFFEGSGFDLTTAAGPGGGGGAGSGSGEYRDDAGNLIGGIDRFGKLGTDFWGRETERADEWVSREFPGGSFDLGGNSYDMNGLFVSSGMYEDWRPRQHVGDYDTTLLGKLDFTFTPTGTTVVDSIHLSGFDAGTIIVIGTPQFDANGNLINGIVVSGPDQVFDFTQSNFANDGVYVLPPPNSDHDMNISVSIDITAGSSGIHGTVNGNFTIIVDAVADQPFVKDASFDEAHIVGQVETARGGGEGEYDDKGHFVTEHQMDGTERVSVTIPFATTVTFEDYRDGSESHFVLIQVPAQPTGADWICTDANGVRLEIVTGPDGARYFQYPVNNADLAANNGEITVNVTMTVSGDSATVVDTDQNIKVGAVAVEHPDDGELDLDNNVSVDWKEGGADLHLDVVDGGLKVTAGWASEGNNDNKHTGGASGGYEYGGPEAGATDNLAGGSTNTGAPITIEVGVGSHGSPESLTSVTFDYDASEGHLYYNGVDLDPSGSGHVTIDIASLNPSLRDPGKLEGVQYRPNEGSTSDRDVDISYKVDVTNGAGVSGSYNGSVTVAVDAVADKPVDAHATGPGYSYGGEDGYAAATAGSIVSFTVSAAFPDTQGSENHFLLVQVPPAGSHLILCDANGNPISYETVTGPDGNLYYKIPAGSTESPVSREVHFKVDENRGDARDGNYDIKTGALAEVNESAGRIDREYDTDNNQAWTFNPPTNIKVDYLDTEGKAGHTDMYEDNMSMQGGWGSDPVYTNGAADGGALTINLVNSADGRTVMTGEVSITFTWDGEGDRLHFTMNGHDYYAERVPGSNEFVLKVPAADFTNQDHGELKYDPPANDDHDLNDIRFESDVKNLNTGEKGHVGGSAGSMIVDAVADRPTVDRDATGSEVHCTLGLDEHGNPVSQDSATWGSDISFNVTVTFKDVADGSEKHYVLIEAKPGWNGDYPTVIGPDGKTYYYVDANDGIAKALASPNGSYTDPATGFTYTVTTGADGQPQVTVSGDAHLTLPTEGSGAFSYLDSDGSTTVRTGGLAVEGKGIENGKIVTGAGDKELTLDNNVAMDLDTVTVEVNVVTSRPTVSIENNHIYENLTPDAHKGDETRSDGALITVGGLARGENADFTFTFDFVKGGAKGDSFTSVPGHEDDVMRLVLVDGDGKPILDANGREQSYPVEWQEPDGPWTCTVPNVPGGSDVHFEFRPGWNNNSTDIGINTEIKVTDPASGHEHTWGGDPNNHINDPAHMGDVGGPGGQGMTVVVDAVAQKPILDKDDVKADYEGTGGTDAFVSGGKVDIGAKIGFSDFTDGSEKHFVLVEAQIGWDPPSDMLTVYDADGNAHQIGPVTWVMQMIDGHMYYKAEVPNEVIQQYGQGQTGGVLDVHVIMDSPGGQGGHVSISVGGGSWEDKDMVDGEIRWDNNNAFTFQDVGMDFSAAGDISLRPSGPAYENDTPNAHGGPSVASTDDKGHAGGVVLELTGSHAGDVITDFHFTNYDPGKGTIYWNGPNGPVPLNPDGSIPGNPELKAGDSFTFVPGHNYSDADVNLKYEATVTDPHSGDVKHPGRDDGNHQANVVIDAVAQKPGDVSAKGDDGDISHVHWQNGKQDGSAEGKASISITAKFEDFDGSEKHYVLVEAKPNMVVKPNEGTFSVKNPDGTYTTYYKVPVDNSQVGADGTVTVDVTIRVPGDYDVVRNMPDDWTDIKTGALAEERNLSGGEQTYDNNFAYTEGDKVHLADIGDGSGGGSGYGSDHSIWVDAGYENDRPNSHMGDETAAGGAKVHFGDEVTSVDVRWEGDGYFKDASGKEYRGPDAHLDIKDGPFTFVPEGHGDADVKLDYVTHGPDGDNKGSATIVIDAVAGKPTDPDKDAHVDYGKDANGNEYTAMGAKDGHGNDGTVIIHVTGNFVDEDGSEKHYALVEARPGYDVPGAEMVYLDGKAYWRVEMAKDPATGQYLHDKDGKEYADVPVNISNPGAIGKNGVDLGTGLMAEEQNRGVPGDAETRLDNNVSWTLGGAAHIETSFVDSSISVSVPGGVYERGENDPGFEVKITGTLGENDVFHGMTVSASGGGEFTVNDPNGLGHWHIDDNGNLVIEEGFDMNRLGELQVTFTPDANSDKDIHFSWNANVTDSRSGDSQNFGGSPTTIVDAVANKPDVAADFVSDAAVAGGENAPTAARAGEGANVNTKLHFDDTDGSEIHYAVLEQGAMKDGSVWLCDSVSVTVNGVTTTYEVPSDNVITIFDKDGNPYYAVVLPPDAGDVEVSWHVKAPGYDHDVDFSLKAGGISVETTTGADGDKELSLTNNWAENMQDVPVHVGVLETGSVSVTVDPGLTEHGSTNIHLQAPAAGTNEIITQTDFTFTQAGAKPGDVIGTVTGPDGTQYEVTVGADGKGHVPMEFPDGYKPGDSITFTPADKNGNPTHNSNPVTVGSDSTVQDVRTGENHNFTDSQTVNVQAIADAPTEVAGIGPQDSVASGSPVRITVSAHFEDTDGSERHFLLVQHKDGWTLGDLPPGYRLVQPDYTGPDGKTYYRVEQVGGKDPDPFVTVTLTPPKDSVIHDHPESLAVGGLATERTHSGNDAASWQSDHAFTPGGDVTVKIHDTAGLSLVDNNPAGGVSEGGELHFSLVLAGDNGKFAAAADLSVTLRLWGVGATAEDLGLDPNVWHQQQDGSWVGTITLPAGSSMADIRIPVLQDGLVEGPEGVHVAIVDSNLSDVLGGNSAGFDGGGHEVTILDADSAELAGYGIGQEAMGMEVHHVDGVSHLYDGAQEHAGHVVVGTDGDDLIQGSDHGDIIYGGGGNDVIYGGAGNDVIYAVEGDNVIRGGAGDDVIYSGAGKDTFLWLAEDFGNASAPASDTIHGFQLNQDSICFKDVFGDQEGAIDSLLSNSLLNPATGSVSFMADNGNSLTAVLSDSQLQLSLQDAHGNTVQTITVNAAEGTTFMDVNAGVDVEEATRQILQQMIKDGVS